MEVISKATRDRDTAPGWVSPATAQARTPRDQTICTLAMVLLANPLTTHKVPGAPPEAPVADLLHSKT